MARNIEINILNSNNSFETLYPKTLMDNVIGNLDASRITGLSSSRDIYIYTGTYMGTGRTKGYINFVPDEDTDLEAKILIIFSREGYSSVDYYLGANSNNKMYFTSPLIYIKEPEDADNLVGLYSTSAGKLSVYGASGGIGMLNNYYFYLYPVSGLEVHPLDENTRVYYFIVFYY